MSKILTRQPLHPHSYPLKSIIWTLESEWQSGDKTTFSYTFMTLDKISFLHACQPKFTSCPSDFIHSHTSIKINFQTPDLNTSIRSNIFLPRVRDGLLASRHRRRGQGRSTEMPSAAREVRLEHVNMIATIGDEDTAAASSSRVLFQRYVLIGLNILNKWI